MAPPRVDASTHCAQGYLITSHIKEVAVELFPDFKEKARIYNQAENKGVAKFLGESLPNYYILCRYPKMSPSW